MNSEAKFILAAGWYIRVDTIRAIHYQRDIALEIFHADGEAYLPAGPTAASVFDALCESLPLRATNASWEKQRQESASA